MPPLTCRELVELVTDYLDNALPHEQHVRFEEHVSGCGGCTAYLAQMRKTILVLGKLTEESLDPESKDELLHVFRNWKNDANFTSE